MFGGDASSSTTPKTCPTCPAVTGLRCGSVIQCRPDGGNLGARRSMMLPTTPFTLMDGTGCPPAPGICLAPEKRVTNASPGASPPNCAADGPIESQPITAAA